MRLFKKWLLFIGAIWGIPSVILWWSIFAISAFRYEENVKEVISSLEKSLEEFSEKAEPTVFFTDLLNNLFSTQLRGLYVKKEVIEKILNNFQKKFPAGLMNIYLFDREGKLVPQSEVASEAEQLFFMIRQPWTVPLELEKCVSQELIKIAYSPELLVKVLRGRPGKVLQISRNLQGTFGYYEYIKEMPKNRVAGILVLIHQGKLNQDFIFNTIISEITNNNELGIGYFDDSGKKIVPKLINESQAGEILRKYNVSPGNQFFYDGFIAFIRRFDDNTLLMGIKKMPHYPIRLFLLISPIFGILSYLLLRISYDVIVWQQKYSLPFWAKGSGFFALSFGIPLIASIVLAHLYLEQKRATHLEEFRRDVFDRLTQIDIQFKDSIQRKLLIYQQLMQSIKHKELSPLELKRIIHERYLKGEFDSYYLVSSMSEMIGDFRYLSSEIRRHLKKPHHERLKIFQSWIDRGFTPTKFQIEKLTLKDNDPENIFPPFWEKDEQVKLFVIQTANLAMIEYNLAHNVQMVKKPSVSELAFGSLFESEGRKLLNAAKVGRGEFVPLEGTGEYSLSFMDIIPGKTGEAWYALILFHDLLVLEREYLEWFFQNFPNSTIGTQIHAISYHPISPNFPDFFGYSKFEKVIKKAENSKTNKYVIREKVNGEECEICILKCSFMKRYFLIGLTPISYLQTIQNEFIKNIFITLLALFCFGIALVFLLWHNLFKPIGYLFASLSAMQAKDFSYRIPVTSRDELGKLCLAFNQAMVRLKDMELASVVQATLFPQQNFMTEKFVIMGKNVMTQSVGGDYYDFIPLCQGMTAIVVGDVAGHGISAALVMAMAKAAFSILCQRYPDTPDLVLSRINKEFIIQLKKRKMMTAFLGVLDSRANRIICANAGQSYPILVKPGQNAILVKMPSNPLGIREKSKYNKEAFDLSDRIMVIYSDGIIEAVDEAGNFLGYNKFCELLEKTAILPSEKIIPKVIEELRKFSGSVPWGDDVTIVVIAKS